MALQLIGTDALADNAVSTDKSQPFGNIILDSSAAGTDVGDRVLLDRTNANGQDAGDAINVEKEILDIVGFNVASRKQLKLGTIILESGTADTADGDILLLDSTASGVDEGEMILYNETFNPATFNTTGNINNSLRDFSNLGLVKIFSGSAAAAATFELNSTYINERFDDYLIVGDATPVTDAQVLRMRFLHNDIVHTGSDYYHELGVMSSSTYSSDNDAAAEMRMTYQTAGNAAGEGVSFHCTLTGVNRVNRPTLIGGQYNMLTDGGLSEGGVFNCGQDNGGRIFAVSGFQLYYASGNIVVNKIGVYGFAKD